MVTGRRLGQLAACLSLLLCFVFMPSTASVASGMACMYQTETETATEQQQQQSTTQHTVQQVAGNVHGFNTSGNSRRRASSCHVTSSEAEPSTSHNRKPRNPMPPIQVEQTAGSSSDSRPVIPPLIQPSNTQQFDLTRDDWAGAVEGNKVRLEREEERRAVETSAAWSGYTGTTHSVHQASAGMRQAPFTPNTVRPLNQTMLNPQSCTFFPSSTSHPYPQSPAQNSSFSAACPAAHPNSYTGNQWEEQGGMWRPTEPHAETYSGPTQNPFLGTFGQNPFSRTNMLAALCQPSMNQPAQHQPPPQLHEPNQSLPLFSQFSRPHEPNQSLPQFPQFSRPHESNQSLPLYPQFAPSHETNPMHTYPQFAQPQQPNRPLTLFEFDRSRSQEFIPQDSVYVPHSTLSFNRAQHTAPTAAIPGNQGCGQSTGVYVDRSSSSEFMPQQSQSHPTNCYAVGPAFLPATTAPNQPFHSPFCNPLPQSHTAPAPYAYAAPAIPHEGWSEQPAVPNNISHLDFMPNGEQNQAGQSGQFFGLQHETAFSQNFRPLQSAPAAFNYGNVPVSQHTYAGGGNAGMFGSGWGEDAGDNEGTDVFHTPLQSQMLGHASTPTNFVQQCCHSGDRPPPPPPFNSQFQGMYGGEHRTQQCMHQSHHHAMFPHRGNFPGEPGNSTPRGPNPNPDRYPRPGQYFMPDGGNGPGGNGHGRNGPGGNGPGGNGQGGNGQGGNGQGGGGKRWLPPPAFTPGSSSGPSFKAWLWALAAWARLTSMPWSDRGLAVALSLGGRARQIVTTIPHDILGLPTGLSTLLRRLEADLGSELQDRTKSAASAFLKYRRGRGMSAQEHIIAFESAYQAAVDHGMQLSTPMLSMMLIETCGLSTSQEEWIMGLVGGDYTQYAMLRRALKRLPSLGRENPTAYPATDSWSQPNQSHFPTNHETQEYNPFQGGSNVLQEPPVDEEVEYSEGSDDYCTTGSDEPETCMLVQQAWAQFRIGRKKGGKGGGKRKGKRRRKGGKAGKGGKTYMLEDGSVYAINQRNQNNEIPSGWEASKWLARTPCPGCGSRYHRNCTENGKGTKDHSTSSGKGGGKKGSGFALFMITAASLLSGNQALWIAPNSDTVQCPQIDTCCSDVFADPKIDTCCSDVFGNPKIDTCCSDVFGNPKIDTCCFDVFTDPKIEQSMSYCCPVFKAEHTHAFMTEYPTEWDDFMQTSDPESTFVGLEPFGAEVRSLRYSTFMTNTRVRFALMLDSGAPESCTGLLWINRFLEAMEIENATWEEHSASLSGIGVGSAEVNWRCTTSIGIQDFAQASWTTQVLEGIGEKVPALLGLKPMKALEGVIDLRDLSITVTNPAKERQKLQCFQVTGHLMLPVDWGGRKMLISKENQKKFCNDPLGISTWYGTENKTFEPKDQQFDIDTANTWFPDKNILQFPCLQHPNTSQHQTTHAETPDMSYLVFPCLQQPFEPPPGIDIEESQLSREVASAYPLIGTGLLNTSEIIPSLMPSSGENDSNTKISKTKPAVNEDDKSEHPQAAFATLATMVNRTHAFMSRFSRREKLLTNATYKRKYQPLPIDAPIPECHIEPGQWHFWEWWAGCAKLTREIKKLGLTCGPPLTKELGWDLSLKAHQTEILRLYTIHKPMIVFGEPVCGPWSRSSTNMDPEIKRLLRQEQVECFSFFRHIVDLQDKAHRFYGMEQPRSSELLQQPSCASMLKFSECKDGITCMCSHGLTDIDSGAPMQKQTTIRGNINLRRTLRWCNCTRPHQIMQGHNQNGQLRTASAQEYTKLFCIRLAADCYDFLKASGNVLMCFENSTSSAFPELGTPSPWLKPRDPNLGIESDEEQLQVTSDPYSTVPNEEEVTRQADKLEAQVKRLRENKPAPPTQTFVEPTAKTLPRKLPVSIPQPSFSLPSSLPVNASDKIDNPKIVEIDGMPVDPESKVLEIAARKPAGEDVTLTEISRAGTQLANGGQRTFQTGPKLKLIQELFGTPSGKTIRLMILTKKASMLSTPEPLVSRALLTHFLHLSQDANDTAWVNHGWREIGELLSVSRGLSRKPLWSLMIYALQHEGEDLAQHLQSTIGETIAERAELDKQNTSSLPAILKVLVEGSQAEQLRMLLALHKRLNHKPAIELRAILNRSGIPGRVLALINDAVSTCVECRRWATPHSAPAVKHRISGSFNSLVYGDLIFISDPAMVMLVMVDDAIRWTIVKNVSYRDFQTLTEAVRQHWFALFGPMETFRSDSEGAFAHDSFGVWLESVGTKRELIIAKDAHSTLGPIDRKIKIVRLAAPRIIDSLLQDSIRLSGDDLAAEIQHCLNTQLTYGGISPYMCLFGSQPKEFWNDELEATSASDVKLPFMEMIYVRHKSVSAFHQALMRYRLETSLKSRPRTDQGQMYVVGQLVDIFLKGTRKDQEGWRGPAVILGFVGEGRATVRWQSVVRDLPYNLLRPYINILNTTIPLRVTTTDDKVAIPERASSSTDIPVHAIPEETFAVLRTNFEAFFNVSSADQLKGVYLDTLVSLASALQIGVQVVHAIEAQNPRHGWSRDAIQDQYVVFGIGSKLASEFEVKHYAGVLLSAGRRFVTPWPGIQQFHMIAWIDPNFMRVMKSPGNQKIDWIEQGVCVHETLHLLRTIVILEARKETPVLQTLLDAVQVTDDVEQPQGRVRDTEEWISEEITSPINDEIPDPGPSISERDDMSSSAFWSSHSKHSDVKEIFIAMNRGEIFQNSSYHDQLPRSNEITLPVVSFASTCPAEGDYYVVVAEIDTQSCPCYFPLNKDSRELTAAEEIEFASEVREARLNELKSWVKLRAGRPERIDDFKKRTGLRPLPGRWVGVYKRKKGQRIIRQRLVLKGFAESRQDKLKTSSPTATRTSHRIVQTTAASRHWQIWSLDIAAAFLRGFDFEELATQGHERQEVAFIPPPGTYELLAELDPIWKPAFLDPSGFCFVLEKGAYGLKDAPLLWFMKIRHHLVEKLHMKQSKHDSCLFLRESTHPVNNASGNIMCPELSGMLSLHVDDNLITGTDEMLKEVHESLLATFEEISLEMNHFRHFGIDVWRDPLLYNIYASQKEYLYALEPLTLPSGRTNKETLATDVMITSFRSLVAGIAWTGVTYGPSLVAGSLFQGYLPKITLGICQQLNEVLNQLKSEYKPLIYRADLCPPFRIISLVDSSLGNNSKYSQNGFFVLLCHRSDSLICGPCNQLAFKSHKSKRVASSTSHAETLASMSGLEESSFLQTWLLELEKPKLTSAQLIDAPSELLSLIVAVGDCKDAFDMFTKPAFPTPVNRALTLYVHSIREYLEKKKVEAFCWTDTRDNIANALTKFGQNGLLEIADLSSFYATASWEPVHPFRWNSEQLIDPEVYIGSTFKEPLPPTSVMVQKQVDITPEDPEEIYRQGSQK